MSAALLADPDEALDRMVEALIAALPAGTSVLRSGGAFDGGEIRRHVAHSPAVLVSILSLSDYGNRGTGGWSMIADLAAYVLTRDRPGAGRDALAMTLVAAVLRHIGRATWGKPEAFGLPDPASIRATNLYGGDLDSVAVALWAVTWSQALHLTP